MAKFGDQKNKIWAQKNSAMEQVMIQSAHMGSEVKLQSAQLGAQLI